MIFVLSVSSVMVVLSLLLLWKKFGGKNSLDPKGNVLLITAHPDDECMFFAPTLLSLKQQGVHVHLLCLSEGDYYGIGSVRRHELYKSAQILGISRDHITLLNDRKLPDDQNRNWDLDVINRIISETVTRLKIQMIITFDEEGVSGHSNHIAICKALSQGNAEQGVGESVGTVLFLETTSLCRKYAGLLDLPLSLTLSRKYAVCNPKDYLTARKAMASHQSQYVWFRKIYVCLSRYMIVNTFRQLHI